MDENDRMIELLERIEENQRAALATQREHLQIAQAQLDRSNKTIQESIELQRKAVSRQAQVTVFVIPVVLVLLGLLGYLMLKWQVL
jgi:hypothetical protein